MQLICLVKPKSKTNAVSLNADGSLRVKIKAPPVDGKANEYLVKYLAEVFGVPRKNIAVVSGFTSPHKRVNIVADATYIQNIISKYKT